MYSVLTPSIPAVDKDTIPAQIISNSRFFRPASLCFRNKLTKLLKFSVLKKRTVMSLVGLGISGTQNSVQTPAKIKQDKMNQQAGMNPRRSIQRPLVS